MNNIIQTIRHTARAAAVLLIALLAAQTAWAQTNVSDADDLAGAFDNQGVSEINVTDDITGVGYLPLGHALTINLNGHTISGDELHFDVDPNGFLTINGGGQDGSVGNIISGYADLPAIDSEGTVTLSHVNITTNSDYAIGGHGMLNIGDNVSFNGWTDMPFDTQTVNNTGNYIGTVVATVTVGGVTHKFENLGAALAYIVSHPDNDDFSLSGDTYTIYNATDWDLFCDMLEAGETFSGKTIKLCADIAITQQAGISGHDFSGTFDGQGHTLNVNLSGAQYVAPFFYVKSQDNDHPATIQNLRVDGTVTASGKFAAGIAGGCHGKVNITNCLVRTTISSSVPGDGTHGGLVGVFDGGTLNITGCAFTGKLLSIGSGATTKCGGIVGYSHVSGTAVNITNSLYAPAALDGSETEPTSESKTFLRSENTTVTITNSYYTRTLGDAQGKQAHSITAGENVTVTNAGTPETVYTVSGITAYTTGIKYNDVLYAGSGDAVSLTLSNTGAPAGYQYAGYTVSAGTLDDNNILTMPDEDVTVSLALAVLPWTGDGSEDSPYIIYNKDQLDLLAQRVNSGSGDDFAATGYNGKYFKLNNDINYTHTSDWNDFDNDESNFEAIGGYYNGGNRYFSGHFDGNNKTISGIRIYKDGTGSTNSYQGLFGRTSSGADIHDLTLADARITGYDYTGGIVGSNDGGTVTRCHVAGDVAVCAVESNAYYHGGIAGINNSGTIEQCTSAATLTTADATNSRYYGGIAGYNGDTLRDNLAIGATVPAAGGTYYGAIIGYISGTLQRNYYAACKVANVENATGVGCGYIIDGNGGHTTADVTDDNGAVSIHTLTLAEGITTSTPVTTTIGTTGYYAQGTTIALSYSGTTGDAPDGYQYGFTASAGTLSGSTLTMPAADVTVSFGLTVLPWSGYGTEDSPYIIYNKDQLDLLAYRVNGTHGETLQEDGYSGTYFKLNNDISYPHTSAWNAFTSTESNYEAIGSYYRSFRGHFDGNSKTISGIRIYKDGIGDADMFQGIFGRTDSGADIHDLTLADARITGYKYTGGIVGYNKSGTVTRCHVAGDVAVCAVQHNANYHGGIVCRNDGGTIEQCTSAATLTTADADYSLYYGGIAGYNLGTLRDNLAIGATVPAAADNSYGAITGYNDGTLLRNYYAACNVAGTPNATGVGCGYINNGYTTADVTDDNGAVSIHTLTLAEGITTSTPVTTTIGTTGYYAQGTTITLSYSGTIGDGYQLGIVSYDGTADHALSPDGNGNYTITMPAANVTVTTTVTVLPWSGDGSEGNPYLIEYASQLDLLAYRVNSGSGDDFAATGYNGKYFKLNNDISYTHNSAWNDFDSDEYNFEAIGGDYNGNRYFSGHFDGNNKTISGIRIYKDGIGWANSYQGIFGLTDSGADIHDVTLADARITGYTFTGGIVGYNDGGTVTRCHVAGDVAVCAVQSNTFYHGGIAGYNYSGTIEQCTSAATLTTADTDNSYYYGGIVGRNDGGTIEQCTSAATLTTADTTSATFYGGIAGFNDGTLRDNLAIGATVPAAWNNTYGAITGYNGGTLQRNYYAACEVNDTENATGVGCGYIGNDDDGYTTADVTADNGAVCINTLALTANQAPDGNFWTTYYNSALGFTIDADENACAYTATYSAGQLTLHNLGKEIPAGTAVIIVADNDEVSMATTTDLPAYSGTNDLRGVDTRTATADIKSALGDGTFYVLSQKGDNFGFFEYTGEYMPARKAYLLVNGSTALARELTMVFDEETGIRPTPGPSLNGGEWYDLSGRKLDGKPTKKGLYINNGKKVVIK